MKFLQNCSIAINFNHFQGQEAETNLKLLAILEIIPKQTDTLTILYEKLQTTFILGIV